MADTEGRWVTINGARVFINNKGDIVMGLGKKREEQDEKMKELKSHMTPNFSVNEAPGWPSNWTWTKGMKNAAQTYRDEIRKQALEITNNFLSNYQSGLMKVEDVDTFGGFSGRLGNLELKKFFREDVGSQNWRRKVGDNYCAYIALYNNSAKHFEGEYRRSLKFGDSLKVTLTNRIAANISANYARQMSDVLAEWDKDKDY